MEANLRPHAVLQTHEGQVRGMKELHGVAEAHYASQISAGINQSPVQARYVGTAYKTPVAKAADTVSFFCTGNLRCQMVHRGSSRMSTSDITLMTPVITKLRLVSMHAPVVVVSHAFRTGLHWKMTDSTLAR